MPRYHFNVHDGADYWDLDGSELVSLDAARLEAVRFAGALLSDGARKFWTAQGWRMEVFDEFGLLLFTLNFSAEEMPAVKRIAFAAGAGLPA